MLVPTPFGADGITEFESQLARFRILLEKKWGHDHDNSVTYFPPDGSYSLPLTPHMLKEWARALVKPPFTFIETLLMFFTVRQSRFGVPFIATKHYNI
jgi:hypothetical protein